MTVTVILIAYHGDQWLLACIASITYFTMNSGIRKLLPYEGSARLLSEDHAIGACLIALLQFYPYPMEG